MTHLGFARNTSRKRKNGQKRGKDGKILITIKSGDGYISFIMPVCLVCSFMMEKFS